MIRIAITPAAFDAIAATLPLGSVGCKPELNEKGERLIWLERAHVDKLAAMRGPGESYSDGILRRWWNLMRGTGASSLSDWGSWLIAANDFGGRGGGGRWVGCRKRLKGPEIGVFWGFV